MPVQPYLFFDGRCEEAIEFYKKTLGAKVEMMMRYKESPVPPQPGCMPPNSDDKIIHSCLRIGDAQVMASDGRCSGQPKFAGFALSVDAKDAADADRKFNALSQGGQVQMPLAETFFAKSFGMVADKFGVGWMIIAGPKNP
jgi:PhnB protein